MAQTEVENRTCKHCDAEVRVNTLFCYNCGKSVAPENAEDEKDQKNISDVWFRGQILEEKNSNESEKGDQTKVKDDADQPIPKPDPIEEPPLKSAAAMRRKPKSYQPKRVEIIWEEHQNAPNGWFIFVAILLTLFAVGILFLTRYLK